MPTVPRMHPEHPADIANDVLRQRPQVGGEPRLLKHLLGEARRHRKAFHHERDHPRHVGVGLRDGHAWLEPGEAPEAEVPHEQLGPVQPERQNDLRVGVEELEGRGKHADDFSWCPIDDQLAPEHTGIAGIPPLPVGIGEHDPLGSLG